MRVLAWVAIAAIAISTPALADDANCASFKWPMNRELTAFAQDGLPTVTSGATLPGLAGAVALKLVPQEQVIYPAPPSRSPKHTPAYGGTFSLPPATAATYQMTISDEAWIEVVQNGKTVKQTGFSGSHSCKPVRKSVRFPLIAGPATIEISDAAADTLKLAVLPKEQ